MPSRWLFNELLAHSEDESEAAAAACVRLRVRLAAALRDALARWPQAERLLCADAEDGEAPIGAPPVRVEVRGTAGRSLIFDAFTVGSAPECDVQAVGDDTVRPLHCVVLSMPGGVVVADFWSGAAEGAFVLHAASGSPSTSATLPPEPSGSAPTREKLAGSCPPGSRRPAAGPARRGRRLQPPPCRTRPQAACRRPARRRRPAPCSWHRRGRARCAPRGPGPRAAAGPARRCALGRRPWRPSEEQREGPSRGPAPTPPLWIPPLCCLGIAEHLSRSTGQCWALAAWAV
ncbi:unnamed protein product [Prorocentrum cordatum]|uniref:FHA domain-containing protein n=1 Tax=Prorocentrum cordatum TaxID=2364126 RepID=A0ABN9SDT9_9DINO|nr:unnamed protein product [Polarella glacialis]